MTENERLKIIREELKLNQVQMAKNLGLKQGSYSSIERGKTNISDTIKIILEFVLGVNIEYLLNGEGEILISDNDNLGIVQFSALDNTPKRGKNVKVNIKDDVKVEQKGSGLNTYEGGNGYNKISDIGGDLHIGDKHISNAPQEALEVKSVELSELEVSEAIQLQTEVNRLQTQIGVLQTKNEALQEVVHSKNAQLELSQELLVTYRHQLQEFKGTKKP